MKYGADNEKLLKPKVYLVTLDFKLAFKIQEAVKDLMKIIHQHDLDGLSPRDCIITDKEKSENEFEVLLVNKNMDQLFLRKIIISHVFNYSNQDDLILGIDPGYTIGIAFLHKDIVIATDVSYTVEKTIISIKTILGRIKPRSAIIKIGNGGGLIQEEIMDRIVKEFANRATIELVDEYKTSIKTGMIRSIHEDAAIHIAKRKGTQVN